jgi:hypothetical protein
MMDELRHDDRGALQYPDVIMAFGTLVAIVAVSPWLFAAIDKLQGKVDPLTGILLGMMPALLVIALIISVGVSARS